MTPTENKVLAALIKHNDCYLTQAQIAELTGIGRATVSKAVRQITEGDSVDTVNVLNANGEKCKAYQWLG
jgi:biotin operon repressor